MTGFLSLFFIVAISLGNVALGFGLAIYLGHGPDLSRWLSRSSAADKVTAGKASH